MKVLHNVHYIESSRATSLYVRYISPQRARLSFIQFILLSYKLFLST